MSRIRPSLAVLAVVVASALLADTATAADSQPCGAAVFKSWSSDKVQPCPLTAPLPPNNWVPVYRQPVAVAPGQTPPAPDGWLHGTTDQYFVCDAQFPDASYTHPSGWRNTWWAYTQADGSDMWGWVPEVFFAGGANDEPDGGLRRCPSSAPTPGGEEPPPGQTPPGGAPDPSCASEPIVTSPASLQAQVRSGGRAARELKVGYGRKAEITGVLRDPSGGAVANAPLCLVARPDGQDGPFLELARTTTDAEGRYRVTIAGGPSREILVIYRAGNASVVGRTTIKVVPRITAKPSRTSLRNGQTLRITGRLLGGPFPKRGVLVSLQAIRNGRWVGFDDPVRTDSQGRYRFVYRFQFTGVTQTYRLRTRVLAQSSYPYVTGASRAMRVRVRGV